MNGNVIKAKNVRYEKQIKDMRVGEVGYTVPWAYDPNTNTLQDKYGCIKEPYGTVTMQVKKLRDGYKINARGFKYTKCTP